MKLYHGTNEKLNFNVIPRNNGYVFYGTFFSPDRDSAKGRGKYIYTTEIEEDDLAEAKDFAYDTDAYNTIKKIFDIGDFDEELFVDLVSGIKTTWEEDISDSDAEKLNKIIGDAIGVYPGLDKDDLDFGFQSAASKVAEELGYKGVWLLDEYGSSILVCPGSKINEEE